MVSHVRNPVLATVFSLVLSIGAVGTAEAGDGAAIAAEGGGVLAAMASEAHFLDATSPLGLPMGLAADHPGLTNLTGASHVPSLLTPGESVSFGTHNRAGTLDLSIPSMHDPLSADFTPLVSLLLPEWPGAQFVIGEEASVPEPLTYVFMLVSLGMVGWLKLHGR